MGDTVAADIDSKWSLLDEDALNKGLAARRLQPMIMFQSTDSSNEDDGSLFNLVWLSIPVILLVSFCLAPGDSDSNFCTDWDCCETKHTVASDTYTGCWNGTEWNDIPPYFKRTVLGISVGNWGGARREQVMGPMVGRRTACCRGGWISTVYVGLGLLGSISYRDARTTLV